MQDLYTKLLKRLNAFKKVKFLNIIIVIKAKLLLSIV
jgi:hypothetical protein